MVSSGDDDGLSDRDRQIWKQYIADEGDPVQDEDFEALLDGSEDQDVKEAKTQAKTNKADIKDVSTYKTLNNDYQLDKRTLEKLKKGKMPIEARLDLHGLTRTQAYEQLNNFLSSCYQRHLRCVLVITGKGKSQATSENWLTPSQGVLKMHAPLWLAEGYLRKIVLKFTSALPKDGGAGALYVYLKKNR
jgi:DNA-nicking Smr family endonuclease